MTNGSARFRGWCLAAMALALGMTPALTAAGPALKGIISPLGDTDTLRLHLDAGGPDKVRNFVLKLIPKDPALNLFLRVKGRGINFTVNRKGPGGTETATVRIVGAVDVNVTIGAVRNASTGIFSFSVTP